MKSVHFENDTERELLLLKARVLGCLGLVTIKIE